MSLFPILQPKVAKISTALPLYKEVAWDFEKNAPIYIQDGEQKKPMTTTGAKAVLVWAWKALQVPRFRYEIYTWDYGNECEELIGAGYTEALIRAEAVRYVKECLLVNPYIEDLKDLTVSFDEGHLTISCKLVTIYGEESLYV